MKENGELYCADLEWWLTRRDVECGWSTTFGGFVAMLERGGPGGGADSSDRYHESWTSKLQAFERDRRMAREWARVELEHRRVLGAHYLSTCSGQGEQRFKGVASHLGRLAGAALLVAFDAGELGNFLADCSNASGEGAGERIAALRNRAEDRVRAGHRAYYAARDAELDAWVA